MLHMPPRSIPDQATRNLGDEVGPVQFRVEAFAIDLEPPILDDRWPLSTVLDRHAQRGAMVLLHKGLTPCEEGLNGEFVVAVRKSRLINRGGYCRHCHHERAERDEFRGVHNRHEVADVPKGTCSTATRARFKKADSLITVNPAPLYIASTSSSRRTTSLLVPSRNS